MTDGAPKAGRRVSVPLAPVTRQTPTDQMVSTIMSMIESGALREGDVLPPERELARQFDVARNVLREAMKVLEVYGVVERSPRHGTAIRRTNLDHIIGMAFAGMQITPEVFGDIQGFRSLIELGVARSIVSRADRGDHLARLEKCIDYMADGTGVAEQARWDYACHLELVKLAGNDIATRTYGILSAPMTRLMEMGKDARGVEVAVTQHHELLVALREGDVDAYTRVLSEHLEYGRRFAESNPSGRPPTAQPSSDR